jgi:hypothetical protein
MPVNIVKADGTPLLSVADLVINQDYSVGFVGDKYPEYGTVINRNFLRILENSASVTQPLRPVTGQLWYDKTGSGVLKVYDGAQFKPLTEFYYANSVASPSTGDLWFNPSDSTFRVYNGSTWVTLSPTPLPIAGTGAGGVLGGVKIGTGLTINSSTGVVDADTVATYTLPKAGVTSSGTLGGVMIDPVTIDINSGVISVKSGYTLPTATASTATPSVLGGVKIGNGLAISSGVVSVNLARTDLPKATQSDLGAVKIGAGLSVDGTGLLSNTVATYTLPIATRGATGVLGGIRVGNNLSIDPSTGILDNNVFPYVLPAATDKALGGIMVGSGLTINPSTGALDLATSALPVATVGATGVLGGVKIGSGLQIDSNGVTALKLATGGGLSINASGAITGPGGNTGSTGAVGIAGAAGPAGATGVTGNQGVANATLGPTGSRGATGATGVPGSRGVINTTPGPTGNQGVAGATGNPGATGYRGSGGVGANFIGATGYRGSAGAPAAGPTGATGAIGFAGPIGGPTKAGATGYTGNEGATGYTGSVGAVGYRGSAGPITGLIIGATGAVGAVGVAGVAGVTGYRGSQGIGGSLVPGTTGATGAIGIAGATGYRGSVGATGTVPGPAGITGPTGAAGLRGPIGDPGVQPAAIPAPVTSLTVITDTGVTLANSASGAVTINLPNAGSNITGILGGVKAWGAFRVPGYGSGKAQGAPTGSYVVPPPVGGFAPDPAALNNYLYKGLPKTSTNASAYYGPEIGWGGTRGTGIYPDGLPVNPLLWASSVNNPFPTNSTSYSINNLTSITYHGVGLYTLNLTNGPNSAAGELYPIVLVQHTGLPGVGNSTNGWAAINTEAGRGGDGKVTKLYVGSVTSTGTPLWVDSSGSTQFIVIW